MGERRLVEMLTEVSTSDNLSIFSIDSTPSTPMEAEQRAQDGEAGE